MSNECCRNSSSCLHCHRRKFDCYYFIQCAVLIVWLISCRFVRFVQWGWGLTWLHTLPCSMAISSRYPLDSSCLLRFILQYVHIFFSYALKLYHWSVFETENFVCRISYIQFFGKNYQEYWQKLGGLHCFFYGPLDFSLFFLVSVWALLSSPGNSSCHLSTWSTFFVKLWGSAN